MSLVPTNISAIDAAPGGAQASAAAAAAEHAAYLIQLYSMEYWETVGGVIGFLMILHIVSLLEGIISRSSATSFRASDDVERGSRGRPSPPTRSGLRFWRASKSLVNIVLFRLRIPLASVHGIGNVAELLCASAYLGACLAWALMNTTNVRLASNWSSRAGMIAATQVPFVIALAGKNNVISFLTGLGHEKLNVIHRAAGRTVFIISWTHFGGKLWAFIDVYHEPVLEGVEYRWGLAALIGLTVAVLSSFKQIRNMCYEVFLMMHIASIFVFVLAITMHVPNVKTYVYPGFIFWGIDRAARLFRMIMLNLVSTPSSSASFPPLSTGGVSPTITRLSEDTVRLAVRRSRNLLSSWKPGQHFFIVAPGISTLPWEAHPFTAASISHAIDGTSDEDVEISFIIRGRDGFTKNLLTNAIEQESLEATAAVPRSTIIVDGPYGQPPDLGLFDTCILVAGGSGVSYTLSMLLGLIHESRVGKGKTSRVLFIWAIRDPSHLNWIAPALYKALDASARTDAKHNLDIDIRIFVTQRSNKLSPELHRVLKEKHSQSSTTPSSPVTLSDEKGESMRSTSAETLVQVVRGGGGSISVEHGRPDLQKLVEEELAASDGLKVSVDVSGPGVLSQSVRGILASSSFSSPTASLRGGPSVTLHTETFGW